MSPKLRFSTLCLSILMMFSLGLRPAAAQSGKITGQVTDAETGEPLIGATVRIQGTTQGASTNAEGKYVILDVDPGIVTLEARYIGYQTTIVEGVRVRSDLTSERNFALNPSTVQGEELVVQAKREMVIKDMTSSESRVNSQEIEKLPVQEVSDIIQLQAGVNVDDQGQIHIRGGRSSEVSYVVDGIRVTDDYNRSQGQRIENQAIQELSVISGTFNAEYGQAMSGIINIVTKSGGNQFNGSVEAWGGGYMATNQSSLYEGIGTAPMEFDPTRQDNLSISLSGPIVKDKLTFFASARRFQNDGWLTGRNAYSPHGPYQDTLAMGTSLSEYRTLYKERVDPSKSWYTLDSTVVEGEEVVILRDSGVRDSALVDMNQFKSYSFQGNLQFKPLPALKFNLITSYGREEGGNYNHQKKLVPQALPDYMNENGTINLKTTYSPNSRSFIRMNTAYKINSYESHLYDDPYDPRYYNYDNLSKFGGQNPGQAYQFDELGTINSRFSRSTESYILNLQASSQVTDRHLVEAGINFRGDIVKFNNINLQPLDSAEAITLPDHIPQSERKYIELGIPPTETVNHTKYDRRPYNLSAYIQDKIEYEHLIINAGVRLDYFDPNTRIPADPQDPDITRPLKLSHKYKDPNNDGVITESEQVPANEYTRAEREAFWWDDVSPKWQISPRLGVAYPILENGVAHFSYGYFFQMPTYQYLFDQSQILLQESSGVYGIYGNPNLKPERTVQYELGYKQEISEGTAIEITGFYKDSRNYVSSGPINQTYIPSVRYAKWVNRDFSISKGFTFAFNQYVSQRINFNFDYTYSVVEGSNSDPAAEFQQVISQGQSSEALTKFVRPLDWDRAHIVNSSIFYEGNNWGANAVAKFKTGTPYTPSTPFRIRHGPTASTRNLQNTARLPSQFVMDLNAYKIFKIAGQKLRLFMNIYNLFDSAIIQNVYSDSGEPDRPLILPAGADQSYLESPAWYGEPRRVQLGVEFSF